jgi:GGDEF domain-containing protein
MKLDVRLAFRTIAREMKRLREENTRLREQLRRDRLTGIYNELALDEYVQNSRYEGYYVFADGDGMGTLNKTLGHDAVNDYIAEFGQALRKMTRYVRDGYDGHDRRRVPATADAIAIRKHGDEFIAWCSNKRGALRIRNTIRKWKSKDGVVSFSAGMGRTKQIADENCTAWKRLKKNVA